ncbi:class A beta-lactamase [Caulobacter sp. ErkDOM-YI]|uniref:class A beta-lactamase n=1 Tax=unclassified Caulobacter TaxID=2648921 RepID=UPI003AF5545D
MLRRAFLVSTPAVMAAWVGACSEKPMLGQLEPVFDVEALTQSLQALADRAAPGMLGVAVRDAQTGQTVTFNGERRFPLQSVFKAPLGAAVLSEVDKGRIRLDEVVTIRDIDLSPPFSPIAEAWPGRTDYTIAQLLEAASGTSDNTAADVLLNRIGGPGALTAWLNQNNIHDFRIDRYERQLQPEISGVASFRADWRGPAYKSVLMAVPEATRRRAMTDYLADPRDTATPGAAVRFLAALQAGQLISRASTDRLLAIMTATTTGQGRLKAALPEDASLAHKTGSARTDLGMTPASNDIGLYRLKDGRQFAVAVFLSGSTAPDAVRDAVIADAGRTVLKAAKA